MVFVVAGFAVTESFRICIPSASVQIVPADLGKEHARSNCELCL